MIYIEKRKSYSNSYKVIGNALTFDPSKRMVIVHDEKDFPHALFCSSDVYEFLEGLSNGDSSEKYQEKIFWFDSWCDCDCVVMFQKKDSIQGYSVVKAVGEVEEHYNIYE